MPMSARALDDWSDAHEIDADRLYADLRGSAADLLYELALRVTGPELCRLRADPRVWPVLARAIGSVRLPRILARIAAAENRVVEDSSVFVAMEVLRSQLAERIRGVVAEAVLASGGVAGASPVAMNAGFGVPAVLQTSTADAVGLGQRVVAVELCQGPFQLRLGAAGPQILTATASGRSIARIAGLDVRPTWSEAWKIAAFDVRFEDGRALGAPGAVLWF
jgi:hypothetical protein